MKTIQHIVICIIISCCMLFTVELFSQSISSKVTTTCGGNFTGGGKTLSWTVGEPFGKTLLNGNHMIKCGFQQTFFVVKIINLKTYIEGFYTGNGQMQAVLFNNLLSTDSTACDSIIVELHKANSPFDLVATTSGLLHSNGSAEVKYPSSVKYGSYFLAVRHRNAVETWSKSPVLITNSTTYDFSH